MAAERSMPMVIAASGASRECAPAAGLPHARLKTRVLLPKWKGRTAARGQAASSAQIHQQWEELPVLLAFLKGYYLIKLSLRFYMPSEKGVKVRTSKTKNIVFASLCLQ